MLNIMSPNEVYKANGRFFHESQIQIKKRLSGNVNTKSRFFLEDFSLEVDEHSMTVSEQFTCTLAMQKSTQNDHKTSNFSAIIFAANKQQLVKKQIDNFKERTWKITIFKTIVQFYNLLLMRDTREIFLRMNFRNGKQCQCNLLKFIDKIFIGWLCKMNEPFMMLVLNL